ncbi:cyclase family protein [uncultured Abyssibacter sp.]|uniref:cyclase family protein n=1 Tax=uncultured Abyssibacter sp. TaxID=2320202 RepID=UPI0032B2DA67
MIRLTSLVATGICLALVSGQSPAEDEIVDLTHAYDEQTIYWPTASGFELHIDSRGMSDAGFYYEANSFETAEHGGTHLDAPVHFAKGRDSTDEIPLHRLVGDGVVIDVSEQAEADRDYEVTIADLKAWERAQGASLNGKIVLLRTGFARFWPDRERYMGTAERGAKAVAKLHFPGLSPAAAQWLVDEREIKSIGLDTPSIDFGQSVQFQTHRTLFEANIPAFENLANLDVLPASGFQVIALPMKIAGGSGGPLRAIAVIPR